MKFISVFLFALFSLHGFSQQPLLGRTKGAFPYLDFGLGTDRLGGAKMGLLDTNVLVRVVDSARGVYKVQLSAAHSAWLPKAHFTKNDSLRLQPSYLTSSWRVWGDSAYDYVSIALPERLPYRSYQQVGPSRIVVDIFGATSNTNWITQLKTTRGISNVWYEQVEDDVFRVFIELKHGQHWGHAVYYRNNALQVRVKRQPGKLKLKALRIAIDAGHGGTQAGATGITTKILEKDYTLKFARALEKELRRKGVDVIMTRTTDTTLAMNDRLTTLAAQAPDLLISLHLNSAGNPSVKGVSTYYRYIGFRPLTVAILDRMLELGLNNFGNIGAFNFSLSGPTEYPNCLVEVAFLSNAEDEQRILDEDFHEDVAKKIRKGIEDWLKKSKK